jgi:pectinesterase
MNGMKIIVAADGSGDYNNVQEAIDSIDDSTNLRTVIYIKKGVYKQKLNITKPYVSLIGENPDNTILTYDDSAHKLLPDGSEMGTFLTYSTLITGNDFIAENITFENSAGSGKVVGQALAAYVAADRAKFVNCRFLGSQDTLFTSPVPEDPPSLVPKEDTSTYCRQFYKNCYIRGDVDFIFGSATAVFKECEIYSNNRNMQTNGYITAASTYKDQPFGYVFLNCRLLSDAAENSVFLGRPWREYAKTAFINCWMGPHIKAEGWHNWSKPERESTVSYEEYSNSGPGANSDDRVGWTKFLDELQAKTYTIENILSGTDGWNPEEEH